MFLCVCSLEKFVNEAQQVEAEPISTLLADELDAKRSIEKKIEKLVGRPEVLLCFSQPVLLAFIVDCIQL